MVRGKNILLGVTGGIAAYKTTYLVRLLIKAGARVKVILTPAARDFVSPLTLATLSKNPVLWEYYDSEDPEGKWNNHVELGLWADLFLIAPATSNTLSKMASARADNLLLGCYLSAKCPVYFAPAMDLDMYRHPANQGNIKKLQGFGNKFIPAESGELASGLEGEGRMAEPENIIRFIESDLRSGLRLKGKRVLINAGPTYEALDPVRFLGNRSSGKTGIALAEAAFSLGAEVTLVLGPTHLQPASQGIALKRVESAEEMHTACKKAFEKADLTILSAAVSDYRPKARQEQKIKKTESDALHLELVKNPDILFDLGKLKRENQVLVGFALETQNAIEYGKEKLHKKNCDVIVVNSPDDKARGFGHDTNEVTLVNRDGSITPLELKSKQALAHEILNYLIQRFYS